MSEQPTHISEAIPAEFNPAKLRETLDRPFPPECIKTRKGNFGVELSYVEGHEFIKRMNETFGVAWSFQIILHEVLDEEVLVLGKLTTHGHIRMTFGGSQITRAKESGESVSIADDLKAAATDAFKKACSFLGVGLHLYCAHENSSQPTTKSGNGNGRTKGNGSNNRLTSRQQQAILAIGKDRDLDKNAINYIARERFGRNVDSVPEVS